MAGLGPGAGPVTEPRPKAELQAEGDWLSDLAAEIEALMAAPGAPYLKAVLLAALLGPIPAELVPVAITARPPAGASLNPDQLQAARAALEAYLAGESASSACR